MSTEFVLCVMCACSINMNYFLFLRILHEYQCYIKMNLNTMWESLILRAELESSEVVSGLLTTHFLDHTNDMRQPRRETQPAHWHMQQTVYMQLRTCFSSLFECIQCSLVWSLTWCKKFDFQHFKHTHTHQNIYNNWLFKHLEAAGFY